MIARKIRAWDQKDLRLITHEQEFVPLKVTNIGVFRKDCILDKWDLLDRDRFILMDSVGTTDKWGTDIYAGDIVTSHIPDTNGKMAVGVISYQGSSLGIMCLSNVSCTAYLNYTYEEKMAFLGESCTVLGNVFEDMELLPDEFITDPVSLMYPQNHSTTPLGAPSPECIEPCCILP